MDWQWQDQLQNNLADMTAEDLRPVGVIWGRGFRRWTYTHLI